jgi:large subunit ribosomal protein L18e
MNKNNQLTELIQDLKRASAREEVGVWSAVADDLARSTRRHAQVNLGAIARATKAGEIVVVPGKVLGDGEMPHSITIAALGFSASATRKLAQSKATVLTIQDLVTKDPKGKTVRILA